MKNKDLKILFAGVLIGVVLTLLIVRIVDGLNQEVIVLEEDEMDELFVPTERESTNSGEESSMSAVEISDFEQF